VMADCRRPAGGRLRAALVAHRADPQRRRAKRTTHRLLRHAAGDVDPRFHQRADSCQGCLGHHAGGTVAFGHRDFVGACRGLGGLFGPACQGGAVMRMKMVSVFLLAFVLSACSEEPPAPAYGESPELPEPERGLLPDMVISMPTEWGEDTPTVPEGYTIQAIATDLNVPRQTLVLPNGDILVAEGSGGHAPVQRPKDLIANYVKKQGKTDRQGGDRLTLLRDADGDGTYETQGVFADNLNAPYGMALVDDSLYVANQDALLRFDCQEGQTQASGPPDHVANLPAVYNHHWTKALTAG